MDGKRLAERKKKLTMKESFACAPERSRYA
jgi:hypothetical protein